MLVLMKLRYLVRMVMGTKATTFPWSLEDGKLINMQSLKQSYQVVTIIIPILLVRKLSHKQAKYFTKVTGSGRARIQS